MKTLRIMSIILLSIVTESVSAQYQSIFGQNSTQWVFEWHNLPGGAQDTVYVEKDTTAYGQDWKKILVTRNNNYSALLREDTTLGKVWYKALFGDYSDTVVKTIFDFSLSVNDTFDVSNVWTGGPNTTTTTQNTVDSVYYQNGLKHIRFKGGIYLFVEGIGGNIGILWKQYNTVFLSQYLLCSYKDGIRTSYVNKRYNGDCDVFSDTGIDDVKIDNDKISIHPNPAFDEIRFKVSHGTQIKNTSVYDTQGRLLSRGDNKSSIDISDLHSGVYLLQFMTADHIIVNKLFTKH